MGYREDANFNINWEFDGKSKPGVYARENAPFLFPDDGIRFLQAQAALDKLRNSNTVIANGNYKIHRGYIRNLEQPAFGDVPVIRCNFQFNPQQIQQNVAMRDDVYLPLLQPPEQLAQPLGANTNFSFDLFFDRSHELAKGSVNGLSASGSSADAMERSSSGGVTADMSTKGENDSYDIGVMADLRIFYAVIGQGFSQEMLDFQKKMFQYNADNYIDNYNAANTDSTTGESGTDGTTTEESGTTTAPPTTPMAGVSDVNSIMNMNTGNFGILMPNPVRIMFSSLFMVDGFITSTSVDFLKFSGNMVPVQCRIGVQMNALHIGFAQSKTFLTKVFEDAAAAAAASNAEEEAQLQELITALNISCKSFLFGTAFGNDSGDNPSWDNVASGKVSPLPVWALAVDDNLATGTNSFERCLYLGFPNIKPVKGGGEQKNNNGTVEGEDSGRDKDEVLKLYEKGSAVNISYNWSINVWGSKQSPLTYSQADYYKRNGINSSNSSQNIKLLGTFSGSESSSSKEQWGYGTNKPGASAERVRRRSVRGNSKVSNSAPDRYRRASSVDDGDDVESSFKNGYFVIEYTFDVTASIASASPLTYTFTSGKRVVSGQDGISGKFPINWPGASSSQGYDNYVVPINGPF